MGFPCGRVLVYQSISYQPLNVGTEIHATLLHYHRREAPAVPHGRGSGATSQWGVATGQLEKELSPESTCYAVHITESGDRGYQISDGCSTVRAITNMFHKPQQFALRSLITCWDRPWSRASEVPADGR